MASFDWLEPETLDDALAAVAGGDPDVRLLAGGTALTLVIQQGLLRPTRLVCLKRLRRQLGEIRRDDAGTLRMGALATLADLERSPEVAAAAPVLVQALHEVANPRIRHMATLGGHLAYADPHLDLPPVLIALGARVKAVSVSGRERWIDMADLVRGYYTTSLEPGEMVTEVAVPASARPLRGFYLRYTTRPSDDWPILGLAAFVTNGGGRINDVRLVVGGMCAAPTRLVNAERIVRGADTTAVPVDAAADAAANEVTALEDLQASAWYRTEMLRVNVRRALARLLAPKAANGLGGE
jgi:carbon-monoxide dehydrogenase medium subunit